MPQLVVFHSGDVRGQFSPTSGGQALGGLARRATVVDAERVTGAAIVQVDVGDLLPAINTERVDDVADVGGEGFNVRASMLLTAYRRMGVDAMLLGERELALGLPRLLPLLARIKVPIVASNLTDLTGSSPFAATRVIEAGGHRVGIFGIIELAPGDLDLVKAEVRLADALETTRTMVNRLRRDLRADLIIGLFHLSAGSTRLQELTSQVSGIDVAILGHHSSRETTLGATRYVDVGWLGTHLGRVAVRYDSASARPKLTPEVVPLTADLREHYGVALIKRIEDGPILHLFEEPKAIAGRAGSRSTANSPRDPPEDWLYSGTPGCGLCHLEQTKQWSTTAHASALDTLKHVGHERDPTCLGCHMTAFVQPGGTRNYRTAIAFFTDVGCESCHGPGAVHIVDPVKTPGSGKGTSRAVAAMVCLGCHTPDQNIGTFDYAESVKEILGPGHGAPRAAKP